MPVESQKSTPDMSTTSRRDGLPVRAATSSPCSRGAVYRSISPATDMTVRLPCDRIETFSSTCGTLPWLGCHGPVGRLCDASDRHGAATRPARSALAALGRYRYAGADPSGHWEASPSPVYGAALLMRFGFAPIRGSNPRASAAADQALCQIGGVPALLSVIIFASCGHRGANLRLARPASVLVGAGEVVA